MPRLETFLVPKQKNGKQHHTYHISILSVKNLNSWIKFLFTADSILEYKTRIDRLRTRLVSNIYEFIDRSPCVPSDDKSVY